MKKISILALHLGYGGIEKSIVALANVLSEKYEVEIACSYKLFDKPVFEINEKVKVKYLIEDLVPNRDEFKSAMHNKKFLSVFKEGLKSYKILRLRKKTMVNYIKNTDSNIIISSRDIFDEWLGEYGSDDVFKIGWEHNHYHDDFAYARKITRSCNNLDYLVLVSKQLKKFYSKELELKKSKCKCVYIPNIVDSIPKRLSTLTEKRIISVGRLSEEKGFLDLLKIYNLLIRDYPDWKLDIIGDGKEKNKLVNFIKKHKLENNVTLHGFQNKEYIDKYLNKSSIYVMTSFTESFGIVLIEAMSHGLPCIAFSSAEGARELISSGKNGYLIKNRSYNAFIKKLKDLMKNEEKRKEIGKEARKESKKYTSDIVKEYWFDLVGKK